MPGFAEHHRGMVEVDDVRIQDRASLQMVETGSHLEMLSSVMGEVITRKCRRNLRKALHHENRE